MEWTVKSGPQKEAAAAWENRYDQLLKYFAKHGQIPRVGDWWGDFQIGKWVADQRMKYRKNNLSSERIRRLEKLDGWEWNPGKGRPGQSRR